MSNHIKILLGGSPCTHWSIAQSKNRETEASGIGWELFKNYLYARDKFKPDYFLYENNKSAAQPIKDQISKELGVNLQYINSALVSAQNRQRFYCHNIPGVPQPQDRGILLRDVLDSGVAWNEKAHCIDSNYYKGGNLTSFNKQSGQRLQVAEPVIFQTPRGFNKGGAKYDKAPTLTANGSWADNNKVVEPICLNSKSGRAGVDGLQPSLSDMIYSIDGKATAVTNGFMPKIAEPIRIGTIESDSHTDHDSKQYRVYSPDGKSTTICGQGGGVGAKTGLYACPIEADVYGKSRPLQASYYKYAASDSVKKTNPRTGVVETWSGQNQPVYIVANGLITIKDKQYPIKLPDGYYIIRKLTVQECCRLQTFPDNWFIRQDGTQIVSNSQAYKQLGNSWTVEVSKHILSFIPNISECTVEVLSMYDGISAGQLSLEQLGAKIVSYKATEIDKYCIQTTQYHFPKTIQLGDAFQVRENNWRY